MKRPCKKCLLAELEQTDRVRAIRSYINGVPYDLRTDEKEYERRLGICLECPDLSEATCEQCGCYAELRAFKKDESCPVGKW